MNRILSIIAIAVGISIASIGAWAAEETYPDPITAAPNIYKKLFENERVRVSEIKFNPGDKAPMHTHTEDHFIYVLEDGTLELTHPDGSSQTVAAKAGEGLWLAAETHEALNTGSTVMRAIVAELK